MSAVPRSKPEPEEQRDDAQRRPDEHAPERLELFLQRSASRPRPPPSISPAMRPNSVFIAVATTTASPVPAATLVPMNTMFSRSPERDVSGSRKSRLLRHRLRLAGQRGLDALERGRLQQPGIGGDQVAGFQREDVTDDDCAAGIEVTCPSRRTLACGAVIFLSAAMDFSALNSW